MSARILIIEDNQANLELMMYLLTHAGYQTIYAMDGEKGLEMIKNEVPDLIICDIQIPKVDGYEIIKTIKSESNVLSNIPLIAITAYAMVGDRERILSLGSDGYIAKPIEPEKFVHQIESFLQEKRNASLSTIEKGS